MKPAEHTIREAVAYVRGKHHSMLFAGMPRSPGRRQAAVQKEHVRSTIEDILFECLKQKPRQAA